MSKKYEILRPTEKYSYRTFDGEHKTELIPISDAKYIKLLEKENQELQEANNLLATDYNKLKALADKVDLENHSLINEVKYLKDKFDNILHQFQEKSVNELFDLKKQYETKLKQFLKVVESVLNKAEIYHFDLIDLENGTTALNQPIITELIQEIKSAMEKGNND